MRAAVLVVSAAKKGVSSTAGMQATVASSALFSHRAETVVPARIGAMKKAIKEKNFEAFAELTMKDSNQFHAVCLDTSPPIFYLNDVSRVAITVVEELNKLAGRKVAAYTFDAGPNAVIYYLEKDEATVLGLLKAGLKEVPGWTEKHEAVIAQIPEGFNEALLQPLKEGITRVILTGVGQGPIKTEESLVGADGLPIKK
jgi:diphosphomevalonate decarboxylase